MGLVVVAGKLKSKDLRTAREEYEVYIKITADIEQKILVIGGEYHADAEKILMEKFGSKRSNIWGGGYDIETDTFETSALINIRQPNNPAMDIIDVEARQKFLDLVQSRLNNLKKLT